MKSTFALALALASSVSARTFTVKNACTFTIWPAIFTDLNTSTAIPNHPTGWEAPAGSAVSFSVPDTWAGGRIWGRRGCDFTKGATGIDACISGGCNGGLVCDAHTGVGIPPASFAEFTLSASSQDYYAVSLVDGFNLPVGVTTSVGCAAVGCPVDLNAHCPAPLVGPRDASGAVVGCKSACLANLDGTPSDSASCCTGSHVQPSTCPPSGVQYYSYFKGNCPNARAFVYDETPAGRCEAGKKADYTVTFCP